MRQCRRTKRVETLMVRLWHRLVRLWYRLPLATKVAGVMDHLRRHVARPLLGVA
jgi:hypothetical protein